MFRWLVNGLVLLGIAKLLPGFVLEDYTTGLLFLFCLGLVNVFVKPFLILITIPVTLLTLGLFLLVINTWMFSWVTGWIDGISVDSFETAFWAALILSAVNAFLSPSKRKKQTVETTEE